ncbi:MAG: tetratricopeptide repeat protein [Phycisphaerales bacterium]
MAPPQRPAPGQTASDRIATLVHQRRHAEAIAQARRALQKSPSDAALNRLLAEALLATGEGEQALFALERAGDDPEALVLASNTLRALRRHEQSLARAERAVELSPRSADAHAALGAALIAVGRPEAGLEATRAAAALDPTNPARTLTTVGALLETARPREAADLMRTIVRARPTDIAALGAYASILNYDDRASAREVFEAHAAFGRALERATPDPGVTIANPDPDRPLRVAFIARELHRHSISYFLEPLLLALRDHAIETTCYSLGSINDDYTARLRSASDHWRDLAPLDAARRLETIRADRIDVLIELMGLGFGARLALLAARPAPVQVTYLSYPNTLGMTRLNARVVDDLTDPQGSDVLATERLVRLPRCFLCYRPDDRAPSVQARKPGDPFTFVSFNTVQKINPTTLDLWARVLAASPGARLLLKHRGASEEATRARLGHELTTRGAPPNSVELVGHIKPMDEHLAQYHRADLALDTYPYHGTTTTCEGAWMGVPTLTLRGDRHAARVGASLNGTLGLPEFVAQSLDEFVAKAAAHAADPSGVRALRLQMRERMRLSPLMDAPAHGAAFADALRALWHDACARAKS